MSSGPSRAANTDLRYQVALDWGKMERLKEGPLFGRGALIERGCSVVKLDRGRRFVGRNGLYFDACPSISGDANDFLQPWGMLHTTPPPSF